MEDQNCKHTSKTRIVNMVNYIGEYKCHYETNISICSDCKIEIIDSKSKESKIST